MKVKELETPGGIVKISVNGKPLDFDVEPGSYNTYWHNEKEVHPLGCHKIKVDLSSLKEGDIILCELANVHFQNDGGGENALNIIGEIDNYTIGMGTADTDNMEKSMHPENGGGVWPSDMSPTENLLPYRTCNITKSGFEFKIIDSPMLYRDKEYRKFIFVSVVWESNDNEYAQDIVSFLTS